MGDINESEPRENLEKDVDFDSRRTELSPETLSNTFVPQSFVKYYSFFKSAPLGMFLADIDGNILEANLAMAELLGFSSLDELKIQIENPSQAFFPDWDDFLREFEQSEENLIAFNREIRLRKKNGRTIWVSLNAHGVKGEGGEIDYIEGIAMEVTWQKEREVAWAMGDTLYKSLFDHAAEGLFQCDASGRLKACNSALARIFGYESEREMLEIAWDLPNQPFLRKEAFWEIAKALDADDNLENFEIQAWHKDGEPVWVRINAHHIRDEQGKTLFYQGSVQDISERKQVEGKLLYESLHDPLTGLVGRAMFLNLLDKAIARVKRQSHFSFALALLDVDRFRIIKDSLGLHSSNELLADIAKRLHECLRTEDICARLGSDDFALLLSDVQKVSDAVRVIERINLTLKQPFVISGQEVVLSLSAGIVMSSLDYASAEDMLSDADSAVFRALTDPERSFAVFNENMQKEAIERLRVEMDLRKAVDRLEFRLHFQPIISLKTGEITALEALIRWKRPGFGLLGPFHFVPLLEETGLIVPAGTWVLKSACRQVKFWQARHPKHRDLSISVNVSAKQLLNKDIIDITRRSLEETGLAPQCLNLEITESAVMEKPQQALEILQELKKLGVTISIDDFGTGYSSLAYLHHLPADVLKIDKSFIFAMGEGDQGSEIVQAITVLAHTLGKEVVAEGVETSAQLTKLMEIGCQYVQGYYFSKPVPEDEVQGLFTRELMK